MTIDRIFFRENSDIYLAYPRVMRGKESYPYDPPRFDYLFKSVELPLVERGFRSCLVGVEGRPSHRRAGVGMLALGVSWQHSGAAACRAAATLAEEFFKEGDYFRSITEFRRAIHDSTDEAENLRLWLHITAAYMNAGRNTEACSRFRKPHACRTARPAYCAS